MKLKWILILAFGMSLCGCGKPKEPDSWVTIDLNNKQVWSYVVKYSDKVVGFSREELLKIAQSKQKELSKLPWHDEYYGRIREHGRYFWPKDWTNTKKK